ncbi:hypothetical protein BgiMline_014948, partial [Biomphalaria glabrata]
AMPHNKPAIPLGGLNQAKLAEEQHQEIKAYDKNRDIQVVLGVTIAIVSALAALA